MKHGLLSLVLIAAVAGVGPLAYSAETVQTQASDERAVDGAIDRGLAFLASVQLTDEMARQIKTTKTVHVPNANKRLPAKAEQVTETSVLPELAGSIAINDPGSTGITSLALMAFMAKGHVPGRGRYGEVLNRGIDYLLSQPQDEGKRGGYIVCRHKIGQASGRGSGLMYEHCISTLLLAEVSGMVDAKRQERLNKVLAQALARILEAQKVPKANPADRGGWRYSPQSESSDISLSGWALQALRAAKLNGAAVPNEAIDDATGYIVNCYDEVSGGFKYVTGHGPGFGRTGIGILCLTLCGKGDHKSIRPAARYLLGNMPTEFENGNHSIYGWYYASQAAFQLGPDYWQQFSPRMHKLLLPPQRADGSWPAAEGLQSGSCCQVYTTSLAILALTPPYQQLPIYQRVESGD